jgi:hypothetical protein
MVLVSLIYHCIQANIRKKNLRNANTYFVKEENNPLFTSNTSLTFNWGGLLIKFKPSQQRYSLTHNE